MTELTYTVVGKDHASAAFRDVARDAGKMNVSVANAGRGVANTGSHLKNLGTILKATVVGMGAMGVAAGAVAVRVGKTAVTAASDLNETVSKSAAIFGKNQGAMLKWSQSAAASFGLSRQEALAGAAQFGNFFDQVGVGGKRAMDMSKRIVQLSADFASFSNADPAQVMNAFQSATRGEYDALQAYLPTISATRVNEEALIMTGKEKANQLTASEKALAMYKVANMDAGKAVGDFSRTQTGLANQGRIISAQFKDLNSSLGQALLPGMVSLASTTRTQLMPIFQSMITQHGPALKEMFTKLAGGIGASAVKVAEFAQDKLPGFIDKISELPDKIGAFWDSMKGAGTGETGKQLADLGTNLSTVGSIIKDLKSETPSLVDTLSIFNAVIGWVADHVDTLRKYMPVLVGAFVAYKAAQAASNVAALVSIPLRIAETGATRAHAAALRANVAAMATSTGATGLNTTATGANTGAKSAGILASIRERALGIAKAVWLGITTAATGVATAAQWAWNAAMSANPIGLVVLALVALVGAVVYCYNKFPAFKAVIQAAFQGVAATGKWLWENVLKPTFSAIGAAATWVWKNAIVPAFNGIKLVWNNVLKPVFNAIGGAVGWVKDSFKTAVDGIGSIWGRLKSIATAPIKFYLETVINKGLIAGWNWIDDKVLSGKFHIDPIPVPFATGGVYPGYTPGRDVGLAAVSGGEAIMRPEWTAAVGESRVNRWNEMARNRGIQAVKKDMGIPGFAQGGIFQQIKGLGQNAMGMVSQAFHGAMDFISNPMGYIAKIVSGPLRGLERIAESRIGKQTLAITKTLIERVKKAIQGIFAFSSMGGGLPMIGGPSGSSVEAIFNIARRFNPAVTVSSGFRNTADYHGQGLAADLIGGGKTGMIDIARGFYGMSNRLLELIHSGGGGFYVKNGQRVPASFYRSVIASHYDHVHVAANRNALYDDGGWLMPGITIAENRTGKPERVLAPGATETLVAPIVLELDSQTVYRGLIRLKRRLGGTWELAG